MKRLIPFTAATILALTGCTAPSGPEISSDGASTLKDVKWEDEVFNEFLHDEGLNNVSDAVWPINLVTSYESTGDGVLTVYVDDKIANELEPTVYPYKPEESLDTIATAMMEVNGGNRPELEKIIAVSEDGKYKTERLNYSFS